MQHAAPARIDPDSPRRARCGANLAGWIIFATRPFDPRGQASCRRCTRLVSPTGP